MSDFIWSVFKVFGGVAAIYGSVAILAILLFACALCSRKPIMPRN